jgi:hypothetical protein
MDDMQTRVAGIVEQRQAEGDDIATVYQALRAECGLPPAEVGAGAERPRLTEPWFCCAEPSADLLGGLGQL